MVDVSGTAGTVIGIAGMGIGLGLLAHTAKNVSRMTDDMYYTPRRRKSYSRKPRSYYSPRMRVGRSYKPRMRAYKRRSYRLYY